MSAANLRSGGSFELRHCKAGVCDEGQTVTAGSDGTFDVDVPAVQRCPGSNGTYVTCRSGCSVRFSGPGGVLAESPYTMAAGSLAVAPDTGVANGQELQVTGRDLMPSYAGPAPLGLPTGGWALTPCDKAILTQLNLAGALEHCAAAPLTRGFDITGSTLDTTRTAQATITKILGGTTDCTTSAGACVVGLFRFEQDASATTQLVPVTVG